MTTPTPAATGTLNLGALFKPATKSQIPALMALCGPTGSGKTFTALRWAEVIGGGRGKARIAYIDTENGSARLYAPEPAKPPTDDQFAFDHLDWVPPYTPGRLTEVINAVSRSGAYDVLCIDSFTHFWEGEGGVLDVVDRASARSGNSFTGWKDGTPAWRAMIDAIRHSRCHVIVCMRSEMEYVLQETTNRDGKKIQTPTKMGMKPQSRKGIEYEFQVVADMDLSHRLTVSKSRCSLIADMVAEPHNDRAIAETYRDWLNLGEQLASPDQVAELVDLFAALPADVRPHIKSLFVERFGRPDNLTADTYPAAAAWAKEQVAPEAPQGVPEADPAPTPPEATSGPDTANEPPVEGEYTVDPNGAAFCQECEVDGLALNDDMVCAGCQAIREAMLSEAVAAGATATD